MPRYPQFNLYHALIYPLALAPIIIILFTSFFITAALQSIILLLYGAVGVGLFSLWYLKYAILMMLHTADGDPDCPVLSYTFIRPLEDLRHLKLLLLILCHAMLINAVGDVSPVAAMIYAVILLLLMPAMLLVLVGQNSLLKTAHLPLLLQIIQRSGARYWEVFAFYLVCAAFIYYLLQNQTAMYVIVTMVLYLVMVAFHLLGIILYTRRNELGYLAGQTPEREQAWFDQQQRKKYLNVVDMLYRQQCRPPALESADRLLEGEPLAVYDFMLDEVLTWDNPRFLKRYMEHYLATHLKADQLLKGMRTYEKVLQQYPDCVVSDEQLGARLINHLKDLQNEHPNHLDIVRYLGLLKSAAAEIPGESS